MVLGAASLLVVLVAAGWDAWVVDSALAVDVIAEASVEVALTWLVRVQTPWVNELGAAATAAVDVDAEEDTAVPLYAFVSFGQPQT